MARLYIETLEEVKSYEEENRELRKEIIRLRQELAKEKQLNATYKAALEKGIRRK